MFKNLFMCISDAANGDKWMHPNIVADISSSLTCNNNIIVQENQKVNLLVICV